MGFVVELDHRFRAVQGLAGSGGVEPGQGVEVTVAAAVAFADEQLTERGWFFDTDEASALLRARCADLAERPWTRIFPFRPTFELVAREVFRRLVHEVPQLAYVEIRDERFAVTTRYVPDAGGIVIPVDD